MQGKGLQFIIENIDKLTFEKTSSVSDNQAIARAHVKSLWAMRMDWVAQIPSYLYRIGLLSLHIPTSPGKTTCYASPSLFGDVLPSPSPPSASKEEVSSMNPAEWGRFSACCALLALDFVT